MYEHKLTMNAKHVSHFIAGTRRQCGEQRYSVSKNKAKVLYLYRVFAKWQSYRRNFGPYLYRLLCFITAWTLTRMKINKNKQRNDWENWEPEPTVSRSNIFQNYSIFFPLARKSRHIFCRDFWSSLVYFSSKIINVNDRTNNGRRAPSYSVSLSVRICCIDERCWVDAASKWWKMYRVQYSRLFTNSKTRWLHQRETSLEILHIFMYISVYICRRAQLLRRQPIILNYKGFCGDSF